MTTETDGRDRLVAVEWHDHPSGDAYRTERYVRIGRGLWKVTFRWNGGTLDLGNYEFVWGFGIKDPLP
jgi:hypothetical protein